METFSCPSCDRSRRRAICSLVAPRPSHCRTRGRRGRSGRQWRDGTLPRWRTAVSGAVEDVSWRRQTPLPAAAGHGQRWPRWPASLTRWPRIARQMQTRRHDGSSSGGWRWQTRRSRAPAGSVTAARVLRMQRRDNPTVVCTEGRSSTSAAAAKVVIGGRRRGVAEVARRMRTRQHDGSSSGGWRWQTPWSRAPAESAAAARLLRMQRHDNPTVVHTKERSSTSAAAAKLAVGGRRRGVAAVALFVLFCFNLIT